MKRNAGLRRVAVGSWLVVAGIVSVARNASADVTIYKPDNGSWEVFANGRVGAFASWTNGDGLPLVVPNAPPIRGGGARAGTGEEKPALDPMNPSQMDVQGKINSMRIRSGFVGNVFGFGLKRKLSADTTVTAFLSIWGTIEPENHRKYTMMFADFREGYMKIEGSWGAITAGRFFGLFSRGITQISFDYGHGYAVGFPGSIDRVGPAAGHIGFGVLAAGFAPGFMYATPMAGGFQLSVGIFEPAALAGSNKWERPSYVPRPEAEATFEQPLGTIGKFKVFTNGTWQRFHESNGETTLDGYGAGYGGRIELGPVHIGGGGHWGKGLGTNFAFEPSPATYSNFAELRTSTGSFIQTQLALGKVDINAGFGQIIVKEADSDKLVDPVTGLPAESLIKTQTGISAVIVYHATDWLHFSADYFRADYKWRLGERQVLNFFSLGPTVNW